MRSIALAGLELLLQSLGVTVYLPAPGEPIATEELRIPKAQAISWILQPGTLPFVQLLECRRIEPSDGAEVIVLDVEVEIGQRTVNDIHQFERIAIVFQHRDLTIPEVLALREDFPLVPHLNLRSQEFPRSLCLYGEPYSDLKLRWTAIGFIERIREWLALTARGELHAEDQPLEPLLPASLWPLVLPSDLLMHTHKGAPRQLVVHSTKASHGKYVFIAEATGSTERALPGLKCIATTFAAQPQMHGVIRRQPSNLRELHEFLQPAHVDLLQELRTRLSSWAREPDILDAHLVLIVILPKIRGAAGDVEDVEMRAFMSQQLIRDVGAQIGVWTPHEGQLGLIIPADQTKQGEGIALWMLNPTFALSRDLAAGLNGVSKRDSRRVTAVGLGALGSQVFMNLIRQGFGEWTLIDDDDLLPHNLARHALFGFAVGYPKAETLARVANDTIDGEPIATALVADVLQPGITEDAVRRSLVEAEVILDLTASIAVAHHVARDVSSSARRMSMFLSPSGIDAVMLVEDLQRKTPLDWLEMLCFRELVRVPELAHYLRGTDGRIRYGPSCRDLSSTIPQDFVAVHAALMSRALPRCTANDAAHIALWRIDPDELSVTRHTIDPTPIIERQIAEWTVCTDQALLDTIQRLRQEKLPSETGGVLIGSFDMQRRIIYVVDTIPSPPDSIEWPTVYVRGCRGLAQRITEIDHITAGMLGYVGEWHSHPDGGDCAPSRDDRQAFAQLANYASLDGRPAVMLIVGKNQYAWHVDRMLS